jgi:hypothetical protein
MLNISPLSRKVPSLGDASPLQSSVEKYLQGKEQELSRVASSVRRVQDSQGIFEVWGTDVDKKQRSEAFANLNYVCQQMFGAELTRRLFKYCPLIDVVRKGEKPGFTSQMWNDIFSRGQFMLLLEYYQMKLGEKYVTLEEMFKNPSHVLCQMWKEKELGILLCPVELGKVGAEVGDLLECLHSLVKDDVDATSAEVLLTVILKRSSLRPRQDQIAGAVELCQLKERGRKQAACMQLLPSEHSCYKHIYSVKADAGGISGKYKPNLPSVAKREELGYVYDSILGIGMTPPTGFARLSAQSALEYLRDIFRLAAEKRKKAETSEDKLFVKFALCEAEELHHKAMHQFEHFGQEIKRGVYGCLSTRLFGKEHFDSGEKEWFEERLSRISDADRCAVIEDFLQSHYFVAIKVKSALDSADHFGSIQSWINKPSQRVFELITKEHDAGQKLREIPKICVHLYCILGLIKGSTDGYSRNSLVEFAADKRITWFWEFDDEKTMPLDGWWKWFRIWQHGLPQAGLPFDRTTMVVFSRLKLFRDIQLYNGRDREKLLSKDAYAAQEARVIKIAKCFQEEINKPMPTLTPRDLFFEVVGGRDNFAYWNGKMGLNPWEVFEYRTAIQQENGYFCDRNDRGAVQALNRTFDALFNEELKAQEILRSVRINYPRARLVIKYNTGYGSDLYIRGSLPLLGYWDVFVLLKCINADTWIFESERPIEEGEFKIYLNTSKEDKHGSNRCIRPDSASKVITPVFF